MLWDLKSKKADYRYTHDEVRPPPQLLFSFSSFQSFLPLLLNLRAFFLTLALEIQLQMRVRDSHPHCNDNARANGSQTAPMMCVASERTERGPGPFFPGNSLMCYLVKMTQRAALPEATFTANSCWNPRSCALLRRKRLVKAILSLTAEQTKGVM